MRVTIENRRFVQRADFLREVPATVRFISAEPLLGPLEGLDLTGIDWLISGGESGSRHRPVKIAWLRDCGIAASRSKSRASSSSGVAGGRKTGGRELDGRTWGEMPVVKSRALVA